MAECASLVLEPAFPLLKKAGTEGVVGTFALVFAGCGADVLLDVCHYLGGDGYLRGGQLASVAIGGTVALCALMGGPLTGASMNPARSLGTAIVAGVSTAQWLYLAAPFFGGCARSLCVSRGGLRSGCAECWMLLGGAVRRR